MTRFEVRRLNDVDFETLFFDGGNVIAAFHDPTWWGALDRLAQRLERYVGKRPEPPADPGIRAKRAAKKE